jgi:choline dehydrogenase-like flavoprotein
VIANRLSENAEATVLLLEAGEELSGEQFARPQAWPSLEATPANWGGRTVVQAATGTSIPLPRGRGLGGSSAINAMAFLRGHESSYRTWSEDGALGWAFEDLLRYFRRSETAPGRNPALRGVDGPLRVSPGEPRNPFFEACRHAALELGHPEAQDISGGREHGFGRMDQNVVDGRRQSAADAYLAPVLRRPNLTVVTGAMVTRLRLDRGRCAGLEYLSGSGELVTVASHSEVVLTAGTIGSAQLLLLSGIGPEEHLRQVGIPVTAALPGVGHNLHDHPTCALCYLPANGVSPRLDGHRELVGGLVHSDQTSNGRPDLQILFQDTPVVGPNQDGPPHGFLIRTSLMLPHSRGQLRLVSADPSDRPQLDPNYYADPRDIAAVRDGLEMARAIGRSDALAEWRAAEFLPGPQHADDDLDTYIRHGLGSYHHPVGTCRMGTDADAVVDPWLRVRGLTGLRVADASVIPSIPSANTNATVYAIAERAAELLTSQLEPR